MAEQDTPPIRLDSVSRQYTPRHAALDRLSLEVRTGELLVLLGPSGCGKTTALRMIAGFERPDSGDVWLAGQRVAGVGAWVPPERRGVGMVFQDYALFPHLNVAQNVAFGILQTPRRQRIEQVREVLEAVGLTPFAQRYPHELSGGQQQRVALARAMAPRPRVLLLDEPFSNLDLGLRVALRYEVRMIVQRAGITTILVTHDQTEAFALADRIAVMHQGQIHQLAVPEALYRQPVSRFVAGFVGQAQFARGIVADGRVQTELGSFPTRLPDGTQADVLLRPDDLHVLPDPAGQALVVGREFGGATVRYSVRLPSGRQIDVTQSSIRWLPLDTIVALDILTPEPVIFPADTAVAASTPTVLAR